MVDVFAMHMGTHYLAATTEARGSSLYIQSYPRRASVGQSYPLHPRRHRTQKYIIECAESVVQCVVQHYDGQAENPGYKSKYDTNGADKNDPSDDCRYRQSYEECGRLPDTDEFIFLPVLRMLFSSSKLTSPRCIWRR